MDRKMNNIQCRRGSFRPGEQGSGDRDTITIICYSQKESTDKATICRQKQKCLHPVLAFICFSSYSLTNPQLNIS